MCYCYAVSFKELAYCALVLGRLGNVTTAESPLRRVFSFKGFLMPFGPAYVASEATTADVDQPNQDDARLHKWLRERFLEIGFTETAARILADRRADWHYADRLHKAGCPIPCLYKLLK